MQSPRNQSFRVTHPFHPLSGHEFELLRTNGKGTNEELFFHDGLRCLLLPAALPARASDPPLPRRVYFRSTTRGRGRDTAIGSRDVPVFQAPEHRSLPGCLRRHYQGSYPTKSCQRGGPAGIPRARRSRIESARLASGLKGAAGGAADSPQVASEGG